MDLEHADPAEIEKRAQRRELKGKIFKSKLGEAYDLYLTAGNLYKVHGNLAAAAGCYSKAIKLGPGGPEVMEYTLEAVGIYRKLCDYDAAVVMLQHAYQQSIDERTGGITAQLAQDLAEVYAAKKDFAMATQHYRMAARLYAEQSKPNQSQEAWLALGDLCARIHGYTEAAEAYRHVISLTLKHGLSRVFLKDFCVKLDFCMVLENDSLEKLVETVEMQFLNGALNEVQKQSLKRILVAAQANEEEQFTQSLWMWDEDYHLDETSIQLSLRIKRTFDQNELL